ncbi:hypothetical protein ACL9RF_04555 [Sphingobacterium sp. Mn56C]|uniref:hypothetical protein n=1 Tax=Sphingobacterium sp. Mn56C TaxID=3395261 RepID=UPI003BDCEC8F
MTPYHRIQQLFEKYAERLQLTEKEDLCIDFLIQLVAIFRPKRRHMPAVVDLTPLIEFLQQHKEANVILSFYVHNLLRDLDFDQIISDAGIIKYADFRSEIHKRLLANILPEQPPKNTLQYVLNQVFYVRKDIEWLLLIPKEQCYRLFTLLQFHNIYDKTNPFEIKEVLYGIETLLHRISGRAMETDINKMVPEFQNFDSPFIAIGREFGELNERFLAGEIKYLSADDLQYKQLLVLHKQCAQFIDQAFSNSHKFGISIQVNQTLLRMRQQLQRIKELLPFLIIESEKEKNKKTIDLAIQLIDYNCRKNNIRRLIGQSTQLIAYEITHHTAQTGEHYITNSRAEYWKMFRSACAGGIIVGALCIIKLLLGNVHSSAFGHALLYSFNYAVGFTSIYLVGATLATKQPAMTASALVEAMQQQTTASENTAIQRYWNFAVFFARLFRSQFIAFIGNVIMAFPVSLFLIWGIDKLFKVNIASAKWFTLIQDLSPVDSPALFHAGIAGIFLFLSGIIAGSVANRDKYHVLYYRIQEHPFLKKRLGKERTNRIAGFYERKWAGIISNIWFGVFMGSTATIGVFLGLDLDIRHITFASGNLALGCYGHNFKLTTDMWLWGIVGIGLIGFMNFAVSFSLSLLLAFRSRNLSATEFWRMAKAVWLYFKVNPKSFFFPPKD